MYKLINDPLLKIPTGVWRLSDMACVPLDPANTDYQAYLKWVEEGGVPLPADEVTE